jgi:glycosyltransferase involved in cell wall biosynthesis
MKAPRTNTGNTVDKTVGLRAVAFPLSYRFVVLAIGISPPGTMGGNSKIILELIRWLSRSHACLVLTTQPETFRRNGVVGANIDMVTIPTYPRNQYLHHLDMCRHYVREVRDVFVRHHVNANDIVYCSCDWLGEVLPAFLLKKQFHFAWVPTFFLFVPSLIENLKHRYGFPVCKYVIYYFYQRLVFLLIRARGDGFVITNDADKRYFPARLHPRILAIYGGVNCEQIQRAILADPTPTVRYDALFCGRLHPQKGISRLLDIWTAVVARYPRARLGIIGNGDPTYETFLKDKARRLGLDQSIDWLGYVNNEEKYCVYRQARVFVHATVYDNNGMVAAEALCSGLPVVLYDLPALRHVYTQGCLKVPPGDQNAYAEAIVTLLTDPAKYRSVKPSPEICAELQAHWDWQKRAEIFDAFMNSCVATLSAFQSSQ